MKRATEALVHEAQTRTRDAQGNVDQDNVDTGAAAVSVSVSGSKMVSGMAQVSCFNLVVYCPTYNETGPARHCSIR